MARSKNRHKSRFPHLLGSKWTSVHPVLGWRHFQVKERQEGKGGIVFAKLEAVCDPQVQIWVNAAALRNPQLWQAGWTPLQQGIPCGPNHPEHTPAEEAEDSADWAGV